MQLKDWRWTPALAGVHFFAALIFCFAVFPRLADATSGLDPDGYGHLGRVLYETGAYSSIEKAPLYPGFVALVSALAGGYRIPAVQLAQCLISALGVGVLVAVFRRTLPDDRMAILAGLGCALFPLSLWYIPRLWTETFLTAGLALFMLALVQLLQRPGLRTAALCGLAAGLLALSKGIMLIFLPMTPAALWLVFGRRAWRWMLVFLAAALLLLLPWTCRNLRLTGELLPVHAEGGYNFYLGNGFARHWEAAPLSYILLKDLTESDMAAAFPDGLPEGSLAGDRELFRAAWQELAARPVLWARKIGLGAGMFWYLAADRSKSLLTAALQLPLAALALAGAVRWIRRRDGAWVLWLPVAGVWGACAVVFAFGRLSAPVMPYVIAMAVYAMVRRKQKDPLERVS